MGRYAIVCEAERSGYDISQVADSAMTIGELKELLRDFDDDDLFIISHDNGYTYGSLSSWSMQEAQEDDEGNWELY